VTDWGPTNIRRRRTKFSRPCDLTPGICTPLLYINIKILLISRCYQHSWHTFQ